MYSRQYEALLFQVTMKLKQTSIIKDTTVRLVFIHSPVLHFPRPELEVTPVLELVHSQYVLHRFKYHELNPAHYKSNMRWSVGVPS